MASRSPIFWYYFMIHLCEVAEIENNQGSQGGLPLPQLVFFNYPGWGGGAKTKFLCRCILASGNIVTLRELRFFLFSLKWNCQVMGEAFQGVLPTSDMTSKKMVDKLFCQNTESRQELTEKKKKNSNILRCNDGKMRQRQFSQRNRRQAG